MDGTHRLSLFFLVFCLFESAQAMQGAANAGVGLEYSDNLARSSADGDGTWGAIAWMGGELYEDSERLQLSAESGLQYENYFSSAIDDELLFSLDGRGRYWLLPGRLSWMAENHFQQVRIEPLRTRTPANRQDANLFWTGPELRWPVSAADTLTLGARYGNVYYEDTPADNDRLLGSLRWSRALTPTTELSVNYQFTDVHYDENTAVYDQGRLVMVTDDYSRSDLYARLAYRLPLWRLRMEAGLTELDREHLDDADGPLFAALLQRDLPREGYIGLRARRQYTDSGETLAGEAALPSLFNLAASSVLQDIILEQRLDVFAELNRDDWSLLGGVYRTEENFEELELDRKAYGLSAELAYAPWLTARGAVFFRYEDERYSDIDRDDNTYALGVRAQKRLARRWELGAELGHVERDSSAAGFDFTESRALLYLRFGPARALDPERRRRSDFERF
ncbi:outer membrane beta-barrel protein [Alkalilimnicola sp. S0819]|uniref:outer membrane beta-barrel protein n=1 Tax=Alkalilimnicola sp. S0819 TaxID=2613922 RepID=UPI001261DE05|nr:outer membrane beta-barrel protein [Alkalilimnicola sp. S0819]KAB7622844.1 outer membrane beta-barrel protein [Alkalilimnicola sp. S0819]MPQ17166.1 outer membrane beta-barrel protein [Alkalilimnicola sp. S0819]